MRASTKTKSIVILRPSSDAEPYKVISAVPSIAALIQEIANAPDRKQHPLLQQINQFLTESLIPVAQSERSLWKSDRSSQNKASR